MGGVVSIICTVIFLHFWKPKRIWRFDYDREATRPAASLGKSWTIWEASGAQKKFDGYTAPRKYPFGTVLKAWMPFAILSIFVFAWGYPPVKLAINKATTPGISCGASGRQGANGRAGMGLAVFA